MGMMEALRVGDQGMQTMQMAEVDQNIVALAQQVKSDTFASFMCRF